MARSDQVIAKAKRTLVGRMHVNALEAAELLGRSERTVRKYIRNGTLPATKARGSNEWQIAVVELEAFKRVDTAPGRPTEAATSAPSIDYGHRILAIEESMRQLVGQLTQIAAQIAQLTTLHGTPPMLHPTTSVVMPPSSAS